VRWKAGPAPGSRTMTGHGSPAPVLPLWMLLRAGRLAPIHMGRPFVTMFVTSGPPVVVTVEPIGGGPLSDTVDSDLRQSERRARPAHLEGQVPDADAVAEARRALGRRLAERRWAAGYTQEAFAPLTGYGRSTLANVETGRQHVPRDFWQRCDQALATAGTFAAAFDDIAAGIEHRRAETARAAQAERDARVQQWHADQCPDGDDEAGPMSSLLGSLSATSLSVGNGPGARVQLDIPTFGGLPPAETAERLLVLFLRLDDELGGETLYPPLSLLLIRMARAMDEDTDQATLSAFAALAQMTGWLAMEGNQHGAARRHFTAATHALTRRSSRHGPQAAWPT